jgi:hypothetical protein
MSALTLIHKLETYKGKQLISAVDDIKELAKRMGYSVNIIDPEFNLGSIDNDYSRLNVRTDANSVIRSFTIG